MTQQNFTVDNGLTVITTANDIEIGTVTPGSDPGIASTSNVAVVANSLGNLVSWTFESNGTLTAPGNISAGNFVGGGTNVDIVAGSYNWTFDNTGNLALPGNTFAVNYANGTAVSLGGNYGNANVADFLDSLGSNAIVTTGNITGGNLIATANVLGNGYARLTGSFDESQASTAGLYLGYAGGTPRIMFGTGNTNQTLEIDNDAGTLRFYKPGTTLASLTNTGVFSAAGNITGGNIITANAANVILGNAVSSIKQNGSNATVNLSGSVTLSPDTAASANNGVVIGGNGYLLAPNGSRNAVLNYNGASGTMGIYSVNVYGNIATAIENGGANGVGNIGANSSNRFNTVFATAGDFSGNVTAANFVGNISITGNVTGTSPNVTLVAGSFSTVFDNTGKATFPGLLVTPPVPLANLTAVAGARAFVNNANLVATGNFGSQISGGGSNIVPVWSDGSNWYIG